MVVENKRSKAAASRGHAKKNLWRPEEDLILKKYIETHGEGNWATVSKRSGLMRGGKSCRLRWKNYLRPNIKRGDMSQEEQDLILRMHKLLGNRWSLIAGRLPGRTDNEVKNYWNTHLNKMASACYSNHEHLANTKKENNTIPTTLTTTTTTTTTTDHPTIVGSTESKKGTTDDCNEEPNLGSKTKEEECNSIAAANPCLWFADTSNTEGFACGIAEPPRLQHYCQYYLPSNFNDATYLFDDEPLIAYMDSFLLFEAFGSCTTTATSTSTPGMESVMPSGCHDEYDHPHPSHI